MSGRFCGKVTRERAPFAKGSTIVSAAYPVTIRDAINPPRPTRPVVCKNRRRVNAVRCGAPFSDMKGKLASAFGHGKRIPSLGKNQQPTSKFKHNTKSQYTNKHKQ